MKGVRSFVRIECNGNSYAVLDAPRSSRQSNWFELAPAGHKSEGRVLMRARDWQVMDSDQSTSNAVKLVIGTYDDDEGKEVKREIQVLAIGATPYAQGVTQDIDYTKDNNDSVEVSLVSLDWWNERRTAEIYNYNMQDGLGLEVGGAPRFRDDNFHKDYSSSWSALPTYFGYSVADPGTFSEPPSEIRNLSCMSRPRSETVRRLSEGLGLVFDVEGKKIYNRGQKDSANLSLAVDNARLIVTKNVSKLSDDRFPALVRIAFTATGQTIPGGVHVVPSSTPRGTGDTQTVRVGHWFAVYDGSGSVANTTELDDLADWFSTGKGNALEIYDDYGTFAFAGIIPFTVDGYFRRVLWVFSAAEVTTTVCVNHSIPMWACDDEPLRYHHEGLVVSRSIDGTTFVTTTGFEPIDAILTGSASFATNKWKYAWTSATLVGDVWVKDNPPKASGTTAVDYALNKNEGANTSVYAGPGTIVDTAQGYPASYQLVPVGQDRNGTVYEYPVTIHRSFKDDGSVQHWFQVENDHDGQC